MWLCCGLNYLGFILGVKAAKDWCRRVVMVPGIGRRLVLVEGDWRNKSPCGGKGFRWGRISRVG